jgi:hypothetical protein
MLVTNAFSLNMLDSLSSTIKTIELQKEAVKETLKVNAWRSVVGHVDTAAVFTDELGVEIPFNRESVSLKQGDVVLVGQYVGPRLNEGVTTLPEGATIKWILVSIIESF